MATQTMVITTSDLSGAEGAVPVKFGLFGSEYEVDLTSDEMQRLETVMAMYVAVARKTGGRRNVPAAARGARPADARPGGAQAFTGASSKVIREWAETRGLDVPARGRIPMNVQEAFIAARDTPEPVPEPEPAAPSNGAAKRTRARKAVAAPEFVAPPVENEKPVRRRRAANGGA